MEVMFYPFGEIENDLLDFAVISSSYQGKWLYVRNRERDTWEIPGGHREPGEEISVTALRELYEETGAVCDTVEPVCHYSVTIGDSIRFGALFLADIEQLDPLPESEIGEVMLSMELPDKLTYPEIQPLLHQKSLQFLYQKTEGMQCKE